MKKLAILTAAVLLLAVTGIGSSVVSAQAVVDPHAPLDVVARHGMVAAAHPLAAQAGVDVMKAGGNAIDAAIATALTLNVVEPNASGLGGGGFMVIRFAKTGDVAVIDYREKAPASATRDMYASDQAKKELWTQLGGKAIGVPGTLKGLEMALQMYGTLTFADVAAPAIKLAEEGFEVSSELSGIIKDNYEKLAKYNDPDKVPYFHDGLALEPGDILRNPDLAATFRLIESPRILVTSVVSKRRHMLFKNCRNSLQLLVPIQTCVMLYRGGWIGTSSIWAGVCLLNSVSYCMVREVSNDFSLEEFNCDLDHVHLLVSCTPQHYIPNMLKALKGVSARLLLKAHPEIRSRLWGGHVWNPSYFIATVGENTEEQIRHYIQGQKER